MNWRQVFLFAIVLLEAACAISGPIEKPANRLSGTQWQLSAIQSMDDAQGTTQVAEPALYTLNFMADGKVALRVHCNRAFGSWESTPGASANAGSLSFGPLASTRAMCPQPSLESRLLRDLPYVRSYLLKDGKLYLSLMADGGIYSWQRLSEEK